MGCERTMDDRRMGQWGTRWDAPWRSPVWTVELKLAARASTWGLEAGDAPGDQGTGSPSPRGTLGDHRDGECRGAARKGSDRETEPHVNSSSASTSPLLPELECGDIGDLWSCLGPQASNVTSRLSASSLSFLIVQHLPQGRGQ